MESSEFRKNVLQGEILMLLHDIGKLHWRFLGPATKNAPDPICGGDLQPLHTLAFLSGITGEETQDMQEGTALEHCLERCKTPEQLPSVQQSLMQELSWLEIDCGRLTCLGSLLALHHYVKKHFDALCKLCTDMAEASLLPYHPAVLCAMYADTADSLFSKGNPGDPTQKGTMHLAYPLGGVESEITQANIDADAQALAAALQSWAKGAADWPESALVDKRNDLRGILKEYGSRHMAETRLPNNDVSLWQHIYSTAAIFKALLASYLLRGSWDGILSSEGDMVHAKQNLGLLAVRWDDESYVARNVRSYDIVGRRAQLHQLAAEIRALIEDKLCLGNLIYMDAGGVCFLTPDLRRDDATATEKEMFSRLCHELDNLCNGGTFEGELRWKLQLKPSGLLLTNMLELWKKPFAAHDASDVALENVHAPQWRRHWEKAPAQVCPRCGLRPMPWTPSRTGGTGDKSCCPTCNDLRQHGAAVIGALRHGQPTDFSNYGQEAFGLFDGIPDIRDFWDMQDRDARDDEAQDADSKGNRLALVQGILPLETIYDGSIFDSLLSPLPKKRPWDDIVKDISQAWSAVREKDVPNPDEEKRKNKPTGTILDDLLGKFGGKKDGWCSDAEPGHHQRRYIENLVFGGTRADPRSPEEEKAQASKILLWALRRHPAPSRVARIWEETRDFMRNVFSLAEQDDIPFVPLTCDAGRFQILLPAQKALGFMQKIIRRYTERFGQVRHLLPLHLSAGVFYHKAPLYIAMDAARRFRRLAEKRQEEAWVLLEKTKSDTSFVLRWRTADERLVTWKVSATLPNKQPDPYHTWFWEKDAGKRIRPVPLAALEKGKTYAVRPSTFDFEVLDASTRRYDIRLADTSAHRRPHFMLPKAGPRPYPLEDPMPCLELGAKLFAQAQGKESQLKTVLELTARLHADWTVGRHTSEAQAKDSDTFKTMLRDILINTLDIASPSAKGPTEGQHSQNKKGFVLSSQDMEALVCAACDGTLFDLFEWYDFIGSSATGGNA